MTKQKKKLALYAVLGIAALAVAGIVAARVFWGFDIFDRSGWDIEKDGTTRYLDYYGDPLLGWQEIGGASYYFSPEQDGVMQTGWLETEEGRFFLQEDGSRTVGWADLESGRYFFSAGGVMQTGWIETEEGLCYLSETGAVSSGWVDTDRGRCYIDEDGCLHTGWLETDDGTYFLGESGTAHTGWLETEEGRYYFHEDGVMAIGKVMIDGTARYFTSRGKYFVLVNRWNPVPDDYEPNLVPFRGLRVDAVCRDSLERMIEACAAAGYDCAPNSIYRSYNFQTTIFQRKVDKLIAQGYTREAAVRETSYSVAIPGTSEHQLGLAVDLKGSSSMYSWLAEHCWKYGFILRYPTGTTSLTGIYYEPWHFRYVGTELAEELQGLGVCVEEYMNILTEKAGRN